MDLTKLVFRNKVKKEDIQNVKKIISSTNFFKAEEAEIAVELVIEGLNKGLKSGYNFLFIEYQSLVIGYSCFGHIGCTQSSYDLYWIAVENEYRHLGIGKILLKETEKEIKKLGGTRIYVETSSTNKYKPTRQFYDKSNYVLEVELKNFYAPGDNKDIFVKAV